LRISGVVEGIRTNICRDGSIVVVGEAPKIKIGACEVLVPTAIRSDRLGGVGSSGALDVSTTKLSQVATRGAALEDETVDVESDPGILDGTLMDSDLRRTGFG